MNSPDAPASIHESPVAIHFAKLCDIVARLRAPGGCPWDREQTNESLLPPLIEEAYEIAGALRSGDDANFREELGDLLLLIVMHAEIAAEQNRFKIDNVIREATGKLIRRHPHVFGESDAKTSGAVVKQWEAIKREEKKADKPARNASHSDAGGHYLASLPDALPALVRAEKAQKKVARVNFDWDNIADVIAKVDEELREVKAALAKWHRHPADGTLAGSQCHEIEDEIGDLLFAVVNLARKSGIDAESAPQKATDKFRARFNQLEDEIVRQGRRLGDVDLAELDAIWNEIKANVQRSTSNTQRPISDSDLDVER